MAYVNQISRCIIVMNSMFLLVFVKKCIEGNVPQFLKDYFRFNREIVSRFTRQSNNLHLPTIRTEIAKRSFYYNGSKIFNLLNNK